VRSEFACFTPWRTGTSGWRQLRRGRTDAPAQRNLYNQGFYDAVLSSREYGVRGSGFARRRPVCSSRASPCLQNYPTASSRTRPVRSSAAVVADHTRTPGFPYDPELLRRRDGLVARCIGYPRRHDLPCAATVSVLWCTSQRSVRFFRYEVAAETSSDERSRREVKLVASPAPEEETGGDFDPRSGRSSGHGCDSSYAQLTSFADGLDDCSGQPSRNMDFFFSGGDGGCIWCRAVMFDNMIEVFRREIASAVDGRRRSRAGVPLVSVSLDDGQFGLWLAPNVPGYHGLRSDDLSGMFATRPTQAWSMSLRRGLGDGTAAPRGHYRRLVGSALNSELDWRTEVQQRPAPGLLFTPPGRPVTIATV